LYGGGYIFQAESIHIAGGYILQDKLPLDIELSRVQELLGDAIPALS